MAETSSAPSYGSKATSTEMGEVQNVDVLAHEALQRRDRDMQSHAYCDGIAVAFGVVVRRDTPGRRVRDELQSDGGYGMYRP